MAEEELPPSKLGTKSHWDEVYEREVRVFNDVGDEGEVWFGETAVKKMRRWASKHLPRRSPDDPAIRILECGSGNGTLLLSFLTSSGSPPPEKQKFHLTGIDYCDSATILASSIETSRRETLSEEIDEDEEILNDVECEWRTADLLRKDFKGETWDLVMDKGTYDALCLSQEKITSTEDEESLKGDGDGMLPSQLYPERIAKLVKKGGLFLITSCNFTEEEIRARYTKEELGFEFHSSVPHPSFAFGGKSGTTVCTVAFKKI
ncbi:uncharacterized protein I303_100700 [Kwoniella dejecticola CBS 10117]|uniref:Protein-lysine N-methyltransferase EFM4 n=1 Tax=Kwoniella dejecticola CBS 10117 TaxID=1296121 RepID=A0A1A6AFN9_9TREE|nr:uncharacterized protein I303_00703 [Kwoniella dejecticola CBS 10117]OBR88885.1 hypothetical protein I303_00703 [Kwoniella dejecticola CBS 10117]